MNISGYFEFSLGFWLYWISLLAEKSLEFKIILGLNSVKNYLHKKYRTLIPLKSDDSIVRSEVKYDFNIGYSTQLIFYPFVGR
jgi:hypothetical protein